MADNVHEIGTSNAARQRLDQSAWRRIALTAFTDQERDQVGDEALLRAAEPARGQVEGIGGLLLILLQAPMPVPEDLALDEGQRQVIELTRIAHVEHWAGTAQATAVRLAAQVSLGVTP